MGLENFNAAPPAAAEGYEAILYGFLMMRQPEQGPKVNMDTVLLAGFSELREKDCVLELGCAHGAVSLILAKRHPGCAVTGLDIQPDLVEMACQNALKNGLEDRARFMAGDLKNHRRLFEHQSFDVIVVNPPYEDPGRGVRSGLAAKRVARQGEECTLADVCEAAHFLLRNRGRLYMVMRALRLPETMELLRRYKLEPRRLRMVHSVPRRNAAVFLVEARRSGGAGAVIEPPLYIYDGQGNYTEDLKSFYTEGTPTKCL